MEFFLRQEQKQNDISRRLNGKQRLKETALIFTILSAIFICISLITYNVSDPSWSQTGWDAPIHNAAGNTGAWLADSLFFIFGILAYIIPVLVILVGWFFFKHRKNGESINFMIVGTRLIGFNILLLTSCGLADLNFDDLWHFPSGGIVGDILTHIMLGLFGLLGSTLVLLFFWAAGFTLFTGISWVTIADFLGERILSFFSYVVNLFRGDSSRIFGEDYDDFSYPKGSTLPKNQNEFDNEGSDDPLFGSISTSKLVTENANGLSSKIHTESDVSIHRPRVFADDAAESENSNTRDEDDILLTPVLPEHDVRERENVHTNRNFVDPQIDEMMLGTQTLNQQAKSTHADMTDLEFDFLGNKEREINIGNLDGLSELERVETLNVLPEKDDNHVFLETIKEAQQNAAGEKHPFLIRDEPNLPKPSEPLPTIDLLDVPHPTGKAASNEQLQYLAQLIETRLEDYKISVTVKGIYPGPVITRFELELAAGVKVSRIMTLAKDIARSLSTTAVRVVDVIPGKPYVGLELPNDNRETVFMSEVVASERFTSSSSPLSVVLGKDIAGEAIVTDLAKAPHMLVAGTTGSGKSVGVNVMIVSMLYKASPEDVRFIMIDPKMLELSVYEGIPHLLSEVVTDMKDAANALRWCVAEMERRYKLMSLLGVRNIGGYNDKIKEANEAGMPIPDPLWDGTDSMDASAPSLEKLPYIVVIVDEFADLMMVVGKKVEELIARLAQKARAAGIHLVLATQRPSVDVITGLIKANIPTRMAFTVSTKTDSRTILDQGGAESLLGMGDMLFMPNGSNHPVRVHGAFVNDDEVHRVVNNWKARGKPQYIEEITLGDQGAEGLLPGEAAPENGEESLDPIYDQVVEFVTETRRASISGIQRRFKVGYNRAARIVDQLEMQGVISAAGHNSNREVLAPPPPSLD